MYFQHIYDNSLAQGSYFIGCQKAGVAVVIDPKRDVDTYIEIARQQKMNITHIFETHIHADFLSGSRELAALTGAKMYLSDEGGPDWQYEFDHEGLRDGTIIPLGNLEFKVLHTPGHTPESISFLLTDKPASDVPVMLFTGDFVFVGDIGRPDLLEKAAGLKGTQEIGAHQLFLSLKKFSALPPYVQVWPGHGAGSACGKALGSVPSTTTGYEMVRNWAFRFEQDEEGFVKYLLEDQPEPPRYFAMMKKLNKIDRPLLTEVPALKALGKEDLKEAMTKGYKIIDTRDKNTFAKGYIPGSINIQGNNSFNTWAGWFLDYDTPFVLLAEPSQVNDLTRKLMRIGLDNVFGYIPSLDSWEGPLDKATTISLDEFNSLHENNGIQLVDLRGATEYKSGHIKGAENVFVGSLPQHINKISKDKKVVIYCQGGDRATIAYSWLAGQGFKNIQNYTEGINKWLQENKPVVKG
ncbi:MBL fold metallo-hydrolase [Chitinophaga sancti]|uniref:Hydroxyacylglutathione hydrolase n=1 Tax=Chitinophaga sancti TaxID=1004 RepID=A0A1K1SR45_9BACT|nr:MBL fold metallo-hydrolase [Chitinophaga sancti]WQD65343.1 MBL fold metallo-hydrolase [Chitinophaga sancti]WQG89033.1 MBL fold metallo-hydrolase [Chitinophaga sancti]SFW86795.1 hydroxyacylglutathione hydrolase [Chitinophaga sancti]